MVQPGTVDYGGRPHARSKYGKYSTLRDTGRYAYFTDPEGNRIGLWDEKKH